MDRDVEHLRLLSIFHYILGGIYGFFSCIFLIYILMGVLMVSGSPLFSGANGQPGPPAFMGGLLMVFGCVALGAGWLGAGLLIYGGYSLAHHRRPTFCLVIACLSCLLVPFGTVLGIFTIIVLQRPRVREMFGELPS